MERAASCARVRTRAKLCANPPPRSGLEPALPHESEQRGHYRTQASSLEQALPHAYSLVVMVAGHAHEAILYLMPLALMRTAMG